MPARFLQRRLEGGHQIVRQVPDKAYGIRQHGIPTSGTSMRRNVGSGGK